MGGHAATDATWENGHVLVHQFPDFHLKDKVALQAAGSDGPRFTKVYMRRNRKKIKEGQNGQNGENDVIDGE